MDKASETHHSGQPTNKCRTPAGVGKIEQSRQERKHEIYVGQRGICVLRTC